AAVPLRRLSQTRRRSDFDLLRHGLSGVRTRGRLDHHLLADPRFDFRRRFRMLLQIIARVLLTLTDTILLIGIPGARFLDDVLLRANVDQLAGLGDALIIKNIEFALLEGRSQLVFDHFNARLTPDNLFTLFDRADAPDIQTQGGVKLERVAARGGFGVAEHHADLHADLINKDNQGVRALDVGRELAQRLGHQARL